MRHLTFFVAIVLTCTGLGLGATPSADAAGRTVVTTRLVPTGIESSDEAVGFRGRVRAGKAACRNGRRVVLRANEDGARLGAARSRGGVWRVAVPEDELDGVFPVLRAKTARKVVRTRSGRIVCRAATMRFTPSGMHGIEVTDGTPPNKIMTGLVDSPLAVCSPNRKVTVRNTDAGARLGSDVSDGSGAWQVTYDGTGTTSTTRYRLIVAPRVTTYNGKPMTCLGAARPYTEDSGPIVLP